MSSEQGHSIFRHSFHMQTLSTSYMVNLPSACDEEPIDEADEPPDDRTNLFTQINYSSSDAEFSKHSIYENPAPKESLLTRALLTSPVLGPIDRADPPNFGRGMSNESIWSNTSAASTADLTSDCGMTSPSRANTPSPPPPMYLAGIERVMQKGLTFNEPEIVGDKEEGLGRKRCITFAAGIPPPSRRGSEDQVTRTEEFKKETTVPSPQKRSSALTFVCAQKEESQQSISRPLRSPPPAPKHIDFAAPARRELCATAPTDVAPVASKPVTFAPKPAYPERQLYDSESAADSWTNLPIDKSRLLRVDDLLRKERDIRKLSEEAEAEALQEEGMVDEDDEDEGDDTLVAEDVDEEEEDDEEEDDEDQDEYDDDEDEDDDDYDGESGNESDNESGFASDDDDDEDFFALHPPMLIPDRPAGDRSLADISLRNSSPRAIRPATPDLPDSTDFVCGTFDEDKPLEEAYLSCLEERKRIKHKATPQDIDPSFPTSEPEDSDHEREIKRIAKAIRDDSSSDGNQSRGRKMRGGVAHDQSPTRGRVHSPAPVRRTALAQSPAPSRRVRSRSRHASPPPPVRRGSRILSPAPVRRRATFHTGNNIVRSRSLPRRSGKSSRTQSAAGSPVKARPVFIGRGAIDIVKGLEKKRERRKARLSRKEKEGSWRAGEGVEKMRELGLEICGKGRSRPIWVISA